MTAQELYDQFRSDMCDESSPYFWSDTDVFRYMDDAYKMFVRLMGGIADFTSDISRVDITTGEATAQMDKRILRVMNATKVSDGGKIEVINETDLPLTRDNDYGRVRPAYNDNTPGIVRFMIIGAQRGVVKWVQVPEVDDVAQLSVYRLPSTKITADIDREFDFDEIGEEHITHLGLWMRSKAYAKADADTFSGALSLQFEKSFRDYCALTKAEWDRYKYKPRQIVYGGI